MRTLEDSELAISVYPTFSYNALGGGGVAAAKQSGNVVHLVFDPASVNIPDVNYRNTTFMGVPMAPPFNISVHPKKLEVCCRGFAVVWPDDLPHPEHPTTTLVALGAGVCRPEDWHCGVDFSGRLHIHGWAPVQGTWCFLSYSSIRAGNSTTMWMVLMHSWLVAGAATCGDHPADH